MAKFPVLCPMRKRPNKDYVPKPIPPVDTVEQCENFDGNECELVAQIRHLQKELVAVRDRIDWFKNNGNDFMFLQQFLLSPDMRAVCRAIYFEPRQSSVIIPCAEHSVMSSLRRAVCSFNDIDSLCDELKMIRDSGNTLNGLYEKEREISEKIYVLKSQLGIK